MKANIMASCLNQNLQDFRIDRIMHKYPQILKILIIQIILVLTMVLTNCSDNNNDNPNPAPPIDGTSSSDGTECGVGADLCVSHSSSSTGSVGGGCTAANNTATQYCSNGTMKTYGSVTDGGGKTYKTVQIGEQVWIAENLNYAVEGSKCYGEEDANCTKYGRLYDWATAMDIDASCNSRSLADCGVTISFPHQGICPNGWHIPRDAEWTSLEDEIGGTSNAGKYLKAAKGWNDYVTTTIDPETGTSITETTPGNGEDKYGFAALPGGLSYAGGNDRYFVVGTNGLWWSATTWSIGSVAFYRQMNYEESSTRPWGYMSFLDGRTNTDYVGEKNNMMSLRCVKND